MLCVYDVKTCKDQSNFRKQRSKSIETPGKKLLRTKKKLLLTGILRYGKSNTKSIKVL